MKDKYPLVTIVTPSYNQGEFIEATILSVLEQNYPNLQYLVVDGGSKDNTLDILKKYEDRLKWTSEKDKGQSDAINKGFKMAKGEIVAWLNSDDTYEPGAIQTAVDYFLTHPDTALVYGEGDIIDRSGSKVKRFEATQDFDLWMLIHKWDYIMQPATFFKRDALEQVGYLNESLHYCMDWDLWIKLASQYNVGYINQVIANSREYEDTKTSTGGWTRFKEIVALMRKYGEKKYPPGYYLYGASTIYTFMSNYPIINKMASTFMYVIHRSTLKNIPVRHKDGWIGEAYCLAIPAWKKRVSFRINSSFSNLIPLKITVFINNQIADKITLDKVGLYEVDVPISGNTSLNFLKLEINKHIQPNRLDRNNNDNRKLSVQVEVTVE